MAQRIQKKQPSPPRPAKSAKPRRAPAAGTETGRILISLGLRVSGPDEIIQIIRRGVPYKSVARLASETSLSVSEIASLMDVPDRTMARRRASGKLERNESERLIRLSSVYEKALELFEGDKDAAVAWLKRPSPALGEATPLEYSKYEVGAREVEQLIGQLQHGVFS